jgi:hypothetical protein
MAEKTVGLLFLLLVSLQLVSSMQVEEKMMMTEKETARQTAQINAVRKDAFAIRFLQASQIVSAGLTDTDDSSSY